MARPAVLSALSPRVAGVKCRSNDMGKRKRTYKLKWRSKKANHGRKPCRGRDRSWK
ncbi:MAG: hypothetical protein HMLKMBBP_01148 [Planctomycetes bacterium]|nr:hypothetical protein [Planctomycetota bacterium]